MKSFGIPALDTLINALTHLPGIGKKTAQRLAIFILKSDKEYADNLMEAIRTVKKDIRLCEQCFNISQQALCVICNDTRRELSKICVVEDIVDIMAIEDSNEYHGLYHVLGGVISPLAGVSASDLRISELVARVKGRPVDELLLAINPSTEGEATMIYISNLLKNESVKITRIASGIPMGSHLEFVDTVTIGRAIQSRREL